jgi:hypothetical protein
VRESIYVGKVPITSRIRPDVGTDDLLPIYGYPPFGQVYSLLGVEPPTSAGTRRIAGWSGIRKEAPKELKSAPLPALPLDEQLRRFAKTTSLPVLLAMGVGAFFVTFIVFAVIASL